MHADIRVVFTLLYLKDPEKTPENGFLTRSHPSLGFNSPIAPTQKKTMKPVHEKAVVIGIEAK
jgi:hypothetical protein